MSIRKTDRERPDVYQELVQTKAQLKDQKDGSRNWRNGAETPEELIDTMEV
jgi:hypothetical protein